MMDFFLDFFWQNFFQFFVGFERCFGCHKSKTIGNAMNVRVHGHKRRIVENIHHDFCGFDADARKRLKCFEIIRNVLVVFFQFPKYIAIYSEKN